MRRLLIAVLAAVTALAVTSRADAVVNGTLVTKPPPWMVVVSQPDNGVLCTGALIGRDRILTAAHCVTDFNDGSRPPKALAANQLGVSIGVRHPYRAALQRRIARVYYDPRFRLAFPFGKRAEIDEASAVHDVGVLILRTPLPHGTPTLRLARADPPTGAAVTYFGYGCCHDDVDDSFLQTGRARVVSDARCRRSYNAVAIGSYALCAHDADGTAPYVDTCFGDSGSPLVRSVGGVAYVVGVDSFGAEIRGRECGDGDDPDVFMSVADARAFIDSTA